MTASWQKIYHSDPRLGFLAQARTLSEQIAAGAIPAAKVAATERLIFNARLDAGVTAVFAGLILWLIAEALFEWYRILSGRREAVLKESPYGHRWRGGGVMRALRGGRSASGEDCARLRRCRLRALPERRSGAPSRSSSGWRVWAPLPGPSRCC
jgi:hypothetical protein